MSQPSSQDANPVNPKNPVHPYRLLKQGMGLMGGLSILASGLVWIPAKATTNTFIVPDTSTPSAPPPKAIDLAPPAPAKRVKPIARENPVRTTVTRTAPIQVPKPTAKTRLSAPKVSTSSSTAGSESSGIRNLIRQPQSTQTSPVSGLANPGKNSYIDPTNYSRGEAESYAAPSAVMMSDRATGCTSISQNGKLTNGTCGSTAKKQRAIATRTRPASSPIQIARRARTSGGLKSSPYKARPTAIGSVVKPPASIALAPVPKYNRATITYHYPQVPSQQRNTSLIFPLPIAANITSGFGWRIHPITGTNRMHEGTDIGAPQGTPVLATYHGQVAVADWMSGYGLTVILRHEKGTQESRYGHLSEVFVKPGDWVDQGTVIGRVGSTGMSTGPHLHFEWRHLTNEGWVAVDAGLHLEYALDNLMRAMQMADTNTQPQG
jgi:murein DD-endopeptidase MepM/ murein hydrolase activator NlpD